MTGTEAIAMPANTTCRECTQPKLRGKEPESSSLRGAIVDPARSSSNDLTRKVACTSGEHRTGNCPVHA